MATPQSLEPELRHSLSYSFPNHVSGVGWKGGETRPRAWLVAPKQDDPGRAGFFFFFLFSVFFSFQDI